jgi:hypothetical protein
MSCFHEKLITTQLFEEELRALLFIFPSGYVAGKQDFRNTER